MQLSLTSLLRPQPNISLSKRSIKYIITDRELFCFNSNLTQLNVNATKKQLNNRLFLLQDRVPSILFGDIDVEMFQRENAPVNFIIAPHVIYNGARYNKLKVRYSSWRESDNPRVSFTNYIFDDDSIKEISLTDFSDHDTKQSFGFRRAANTPLQERNNIIEIFPRNGNPLFVTRREVITFTHNHCQELLNLASKTLMEMQTYYKMNHQDHSSYLDKLEQGLAFSSLNLEHTLRHYLPQYFDKNGFIPVSDSGDNNGKNYTKRVKEIIDEYHSYSIDLVKMMNKPLLSDLSIPETAAVDAYCEELSLQIEDNEFISKESYLELNVLYKKAFNLAETKKLTTLNKDKQSKITDASQMLAKAMHEGTGINEKQMAVKGLLKSLNGVLPVGDKSLAWLSINTGLAEIEQ